MRMLRPSAKQLEFLSWEVGAFFHFGIRTFYEGHKDWDGKPMPVEGFNPSELDCDNWISTVKEAGAKYAVLVCKHHDGFANWPSKFTDYSVAASPWKGGKGDVVREFVESCRKFDIKVGLYYSPAEAGYHDRSPREHDDYFINQIAELLGNYGIIDYLWFDGCGSEGHVYDKERIISSIRGLQPEILIFNMWDPDTRWVGNEGGVAGVMNGNLTSCLDFSALTDKIYALEEYRFLPAECDIMIRESNWFYSEYDVHTVKNIDELIGLYYYSVGSGANLIINIGPDRRGKLPEVDALRLKEFGRVVKERFSDPIPAFFLETDEGIILKLKETRLINHIVICEDLTNGETIEEFIITVKSNVMYTPPCIYRGSFVGHKRIIPFPAIRVSEIIVKVTKARGNYKLADFKAYFI